MLRNFSLSPNHMRNWGKPLWIFFIIVACILISLFGYNIYLWYNIQRLGLLFTFLGIELLLFVGVTCALKRTHYLHLHHYTCAMLFIPFNSI